MNCNLIKFVSLKLTPVLSMKFAMLMVVVSTMVCSGCARMETKDEVIDRLIQGVADDRQAFIVESEGLYANYTSFRDPANEETVIVEYTLAQGMTVPNINTEQLRNDLVDVIRADPNIVDILKMGINIRSIYKTFDGTVYFDYTATSQDVTDAPASK